MTAIPNPEDFGFEVQRHFHFGRSGQAPGTFWTLWGGHITAGHVYSQQNRTPPPFSNGTIMAGDGIIDACLIGCDLSGLARPREPMEGEAVFMYGFPGGSGTRSDRIGVARFRRQTSADSDYTVPTWTGMMADRPDNVPANTAQAVHYEPVFIGMSGGLVMAADGTALGVLVGDSGPLNLDQDPDLEQAFEFVSLADIWDVFADNGIEIAPPAMNILVDRFISNDDVTISRIYIDDAFVCHGLEDEYREIKVPKETRIPQGIYDLGVKTHGGFHQRYTESFGDFHKGMLHVKNVPNFTDILIHVGNYDIDTDGCLLVGNGDLRSMAVWQSKVTYRRIYYQIIDSALRNAATIEFRDSDL